MLLLCAGSWGLLPPVVSAQAQTAARSYSIAAQPLSSALLQFSNASGIEIFFDQSLTAGRQSAGLSGSYSLDTALETLLAGSGLSYRYTNASTITVFDPAAEAGGVSYDGSIVLEEVNVAAWVDGLGLTTEGVYETPGSVAHVDAATIERFRGSSPASMFRGVPGVISSNATSGAGSVDVNIRGMQGLGRVAVKVDGAENQITLYQGYQGVSNRSFVDPDLIAGVDIKKGPDVSSSGIGGSVAMRTVDASDIVEDGNTFGLQVKVGGSGNSTSPVSGAKGGYQLTNVLEGYPVVGSSNDGMDRPNPLKPTQGSISIIGAVQTDDIDLLAAYAYRSRGNYYAGTNGSAAEPEYIGQQPFCYSDGSCPFNYYDYVVNGGLTNYRAGEEVLNTQLETSTILTKGTYRFGDGHSVKLGYTGYGSEAGDQVASLLGNDMSRPTQQAETTDVSLDTLTAQYKWNPAEIELLNLTANLWGTWLEQRNPIRFKSWAHNTAEFGLPDDFKVGSDTQMWGGDITNVSVISDPGIGGPLTLTYGGTYRNDDTSPSPYTNELEYIVSRDGSRQEAAAFGKVSWEALDWLTLDGGLRYSHFWSEDRSSPTGNADDEEHGQRLSVGGFSPSLGVTIIPTDGVQLFANYANVMRSPSLFESTTGFSTRFNPDLKPERSSNWEIGANYTMEGLLATDDRAMIKLAYFNQDITDYLARQWTEFPSETGYYNYQTMWVYNLDRAKFSGLELSGRYEVGGFAADLAANYYLDVQFCKTSDTCENRSLYADYATNQVPPLYSIDLTLSQKLLEDKLTVGGRISHVGPRAIGHGEATAQGLSSFISLVDWEPYTTVDVFADYKVSDDLTMSLRVENLTDAYYVDPLGLVQQPAPGRTISASLTAKF